MGWARAGGRFSARGGVGRAAAAGNGRSAFIGATGAAIESARRRRPFGGAMWLRKWDARRAGADRRLRLSLPAPLRLVEGRHLVKPETFQPRVLLARLLDRLDALGAATARPHRCGRRGAARPRRDGAGAESRLDLARAVPRLAYWRCVLPTGGLVGDVVLEGDLAPSPPWLVWEQPR